MLKSFETKQDRYLRSICQENILFLKPACVDFSEINNMEFIRLLNGLIKHVDSGEIKDIIGSSASAIIALLLGLGYTTEEIVHKLSDAHFYTLLNNNNCANYIPLSLILSSKIQHRKAALDRQVECLQEDKFLSWAKLQVQDKLNSPWATFADLHKQIPKVSTLKSIHLIGLNLTTSNLVLLNYKNTPHLPIAIAVRICMSFSTTFSIVEVKEQYTNKTSAYADGDMTLQHIDFDNCGYIKFCRYKRSKKVKQGNENN